jgi:hypothetical protein
MGKLEKQLEERVKERRAVSLAKNHFIRDYFADHVSYFSGCGISKLTEAEAAALDTPSTGLCIYVGLSQPLPEDHSLPSVYEGFAVAYRHTGPLRALERK